VLLDGGGGVGVGGSGEGLGVEAVEPLLLLLRPQVHPVADELHYFVVLLQVAVVFYAATVALHRHCTLHLVFGLVGLRTTDLPVYRLSDLLVVLLVWLRRRALRQID
jgi:hypothetical protein